MAYPDPATVLAGIVYGASDELTGTLVMPTVNDIADGVWGGDRTVRTLTSAANITSDGTSIPIADGYVEADTVRWDGDNVPSLVGGYVPCDVVAISGDTAAADSLEAMLDGTGAVLYLTKLQIHASSGIAVSVQTSDGAYPSFFIYNAAGPALQVSSVGGTAFSVNSNQVATAFFSGAGYSPFLLLQDNVLYPLPASANVVSWKGSTPADLNGDKVQADATVTIDEATLAAAISEALSNSTVTANVVEANGTPIDLAGSFTGVMTAIGTPAQATPMANSFAGVMSAVGSPSQAATVASSFGGVMSGLSGLGSPAQAGTVASSFGGVMSSVSGLGSPAQAGTVANSFGGVMSAVGTPAQAATVANSFGGVMTAVGSPSQATTVANSFAGVMSSVGAPAQASTVASSFSGLTTSIGALGSPAQASAMTSGFSSVIVAIGDVQTDTDNIQTRLPAALVSGKMPSSLAGAELAAVVAAILDAADSAEDGHTVREIIRGIAAAAMGKTSKTGTVRTFRNLGDSANRIQAVVDDDGNRSSVTLGLS